jgi:cytochrome c-type biogenesis protein CcmH
MIVFWISSALLAAAALALALRPLLKRRAGGEGASRDSLNLAVHRDQLREIDADRAAGKLAQADYEQARLEIEKRLLEDVAGEVPGRKVPLREAPAGRGGYRPAAIAGILLPESISRSEIPAPSASPTRTRASASRSSRSSRWSSASRRG